MSYTHPFSESNIDETILKAVKKSVNDVDPEYLLEIGAPENEYWPEIYQIAEYLTNLGRTFTEYDVFIITQKVFNEWLDREPSTVHKEYRDVAYLTMLNYQRDA